MTPSSLLLLSLALAASACGGHLDTTNDDDAIGDDDGTDARAPIVAPANQGTLTLDRFGAQGCGILANGALSCWGALPVTLSGAFTAITNYGNLCGVTTSGSIACDSPVDLPGSDYVRVVTDEIGARVCGLTSAGDVRCNASNGAPAQSLGGPYIDVGTNNDALCVLASDGTPTCQGWNGETVRLPAGPLKELRLIELTADGDTDRVVDSCGLTKEGIATCTGSTFPAGLPFEEAAFEASQDSESDPAYCGISAGQLACARFDGTSLAAPAGTFVHVAVTMALGEVAPFACATDTAGRVTCFLLDGTAGAPSIGSPDPALVFAH